MAKFNFIIILTFLCTRAFTQNVAQITIDNRGGNQDVITFLVDESVAFNITKDGKIIDWGLEYTIPNTGIYPKLEKYMGREEYYPSTDNEAYQGKVKYIGRTLITYYTREDNEALKGKIKTIGNTFLDYYTEYDNPAYKGNLRNSGTLIFTYYGDYADEAYRGKIKSVGNSLITYYGAVDDKAYRGKVKNVDRNALTYYSSYDKQGYGGSLKSGSPILSSGSIKYIIKNY
jgi:hypothetical protein